MGARGERRGSGALALLVAFAVVVCLASIAALSVGVERAQAAIAKVQAGTYVYKSSSTTSVTATLASASTAGTMLIAVFATGNNTTITAPTGWALAVAAHTSGDGSSQIWYYANNPGGISSVAFTLSPSDVVVVQLSEWSGVSTSAPLDGTGSGTVASATSKTISATAAQSNELAITEFNLSGGNVLTPGSGWTNLMPAQSISTTADYQVGVAAGTVSETETVNGSYTWVGVIATFFPGCSGGSLTFTSSPTLSFGSVGLTGYDQTLSTTYGLTVTDDTGSAAGWNLTGTSTTFTNAGSKTLPTTATKVTAASVASATGTCVLPTNSIGYPTTLPAGATAPTAVKIYNAAAATGTGPSTVTLTFGLTVPGNAYSGSYSSTWTLTLASGP